MSAVTIYTVELSHGLWNTLFITNYLSSRKRNPHIIANCRCIFQPAFVQLHFINYTIILHRTCALFLLNVIRRRAWATLHRWSSRENLFRIMRLMFSLFHTMRITARRKNSFFRSWIFLYLGIVSTYILVKGSRRSSFRGIRRRIAYGLNCYSVSSARGISLFRFAVSMNDYNGTIVAPSLSLSSYLHSHSRSSLGWRSM